jgi:hypothetical protein
LDLAQGGGRKEDEGEEKQEGGGAAVSCRVHRPSPSSTRPPATNMPPRYRRCNIEKRGERKMEAGVSGEGLPLGFCSVDKHGQPLDLHPLR